MGFDGLAEASAIVESLKKVSSSYDKKCSTIYALADQIMGMERCEKDLFKVPQDTFEWLQGTITSKMMMELHNLSQIVLDMEVQKEAMDTVVSRMESLCQSLLERGSHTSLEFQHLRTVYTIANYVTNLIDMKRFHLEMLNFNDIKSFSKARKDTSCKPIEKELDRYIVVPKQK